MPQQAEVAVVHPHFVNQPLAKEISFVFAQIHIIVVAERIVHYHQRMERERGDSQ